MKFIRFDPLGIALGGLGVFLGLFAFAFSRVIEEVHQGEDHKYTEGHRTNQDLHQGQDLVEKCKRDVEARKNQAWKQLEQMQAPADDTADRLIEIGVTQAVAELLDDSEIITTRYEYQSCPGDLDGMVVGQWEGRKVVVLVDAKDDMDSHWMEAQFELFVALHHWEELCGASKEDLVSQEGFFIDHYMLQVPEYGGREVMFAFGGNKFTDAVIEEHFGQMDTAWFCVVPNSVGKFNAFMHPLARGTQRS